MKKLNKFFAVLVALAMMATLCVSMAFAEDTEPGKDLTPSEQQKSADARIGKYLTIPAGVDVPDVTFTFNFEAKPSDTNDAGPSITAPTLTTIGTNKTMVETTGNTADGNSVAGSFKIADLFKNTSGDLIFTAPGEYIYEVSEENSAGNGTSTTADNVTTTTKYTNDTSKKTVRIYVKYDNSTPAKLVIDTITITTTKDNNSSKVKPDEDPVTATDPSTLGNTFQNAYEKATSRTPGTVNPTNALLKVQKTVIDEKNYVSDDQAFPFEITVKKPAGDTISGDKVNAYIYDGATQTVVTAHPVAITYGQASPFSLKNNQYLLFNALPYGATYSVTEDLEKTAGTPAAEVVVNHANFQASATWTDGSVTPVEQGNNLTVGTGTVAEADTTKDGVAYTNTFVNKDVEPEGILISNLPYIALALVAIGGLVAYVVIRRRNADEA